MLRNKKYPDDFVSYIKTLGRVRFDEPMKEYTSFKCGGPADILIHPDEKCNIPRIILAAKDAGIPLTTIGGGSNLLVGDRGVKGIVLRISDDCIISSTIRLSGEIIYSDACIGKEDFIDFSVEAGFSGVEFMAGIPGTVGGGIMMNAGTTMGTFMGILDSIEYVDCKGRINTVKVDSEMSSYRSINIGDDVIVTGGYFKLPRSKNTEMTKKIIDEILADRKNKHPLDYPSAGSVFKNPEGSSSWQLVDEAGLKGKKIGGAMVSDLHTNFIINYNNACSIDIKRLIEFIQEEVYSKFGINLETEIRMIGEF